MLWAPLSSWSRMVASIPKSYQVDPYGSVGLIFSEPFDSSS